MSLRIVGSVLGLFLCHGVVLGCWRTAQDRQSGGYGEMPMRCEDRRWVTVAAVLACSRTHAVSVLSCSRTRFLRSAPRQIEGSVRIPLPRIPCRCRGSGWQRAGGASAGSRAPSGACRGPGVGWEEPRVRRRRRQQGLSRGGNTLCYTTAPCREPGSKHTLPIARFPSVAAVSISFKGRQHLGWVGGLGLFFFLVFCPLLSKLCGSGGR